LDVDEGKDRYSLKIDSTGSGGFEIEAHAAAQRRRDVDERVAMEVKTPYPKYIVLEIQ